MLLDGSPDRCRETGTGTAGGYRHSKRAASDNRAGIEIAPFRIVNNVHPDTQILTFDRHGGIDCLVVGGRERNRCPCKVALAVAPTVKGYTPRRRKGLNIFAGLSSHHGNDRSRFNEIRRFPGSDDTAADDNTLSALKRQEYW